MPGIETCAECGAPLSGEAPAGFCPACMLQGALDLRAASRLTQTGGSQRRFGDYELIEEIARGGMGVVYRARQVSLDRIVAVKLILFGAHAGESAVRRFQVEAAAAAKLQHPNIVSIHEVGEEEGQPFFSMEYVAGRDLEKYAQDHPVTTWEAARLVRAMAQAIHYAHEQGIVHRDLKPSNILIDGASEPHITDFGLAKHLDDGGARALSQGLTLTGQVLGSPSFLPPEQASARRGHVGPHTDIYALGAVLYFLLTARPPFRAASLSDTLQEVLNEEPVAPRLLNRRVPRDLETICLKCLEKEPARRYLTARNLAEELGRFLEGRPIHARPVGPPARAWRWCRRHPAVASLSATVVFLVVALAIGSSVAAVRLQIARNTATRTVHELKLQSAERFLEDGDSSSAIAVLSRMLRENAADHVAASWIMDILGRFAYPVPVTPELQSMGFSPHQARFSPDGSMVATGGPALMLWASNTGVPIAPAINFGSVHYLEFSSDGRLVACACGDGTARIVDVRTCKESAPPMQHGQPVFSARFSPDGTRLVTSTRARFARVWSVQSGEPITGELRHDDEVNWAEFSPDGRTVVTASEDGTAMIWNAASGITTVGPLRHLAEVWMAKFSPDGMRVATVSRDRTARVWDTRTGLAVTEPLRHRDFVEFLEFSPDGQWLVTCSYDKTARIWNVRTGAPRTSSLRHAEKVNSAKFSPDGRRLVTASADGLAHVWDSETGEPMGRAITHTRKVWYAEFGPDGRRILTHSGDGTARVWAYQEGPGPVRVLPHGLVVADAAYNPSGRLFATACYDGKVRFWDGTSPRPLPPALPHPRQVTHLEWSPNGKLLASLCRDGITRVWQNSPDSQPVFEVPRNTRGARSADFSSDGSLLLLVQDCARFYDVATGRQHGDPLCSPDQDWLTRGRLSPDGRLAALVTGGRRVFIFDVETRLQVGKPLPHQGGITQLEFSRDGRFLLTAAMDRQARVWDLRTGSLHAPSLRHNIELTDARFDPQCERIVTASADATARVWDAHTGRPLTAALRHDSKLTSACFSPDGSLVLTASIDGTARLWDSRTGKPVYPPLIHGAGVTAARFSPDGKRVITASRDGTARLWSPPTAPAVVPGWFPTFAEAMAGKRVNEIGAFEFVPGEGLSQIRDYLKSLPVDEPCADWAKGFLIPR